MPQLQSLLQQFDAISLQEMDRVALLKRTDTKFLFHADSLPEILNKINEAYAILEIDGLRLHAYESYYYDTMDLKHYFDHHNNKLGRLKVRKRAYKDTGISFLETKYKTQKGDISKKRIAIDQINEELSNSEYNFIKKQTKEVPLNLTLKNSFKRFTLVNKKRKERVTVDVYLNVENEDQNFSFENLVILEIKQSQLDRGSELFQVLKDFGIRKSGMSKYCLGIAMLDPELKSNAFKPNLLKIDKILSDG